MINAGGDVKKRGTSWCPEMVVSLRWSFSMRKRKAKPEVDAWVLAFLQFYGRTALFTIQKHIQIEERGALNLSQRAKRISAVSNSVKSKRLAILLSNFLLSCPNQSSHIPDWKEWLNGKPKVCSGQQPQEGTTLRAGSNCCWTTPNSISYPETTSSDTNFYQNSSTEIKTAKKTEMLMKKTAEQISSLRHSQAAVPWQFQHDGT